MRSYRRNEEKFNFPDKTPSILPPESLKKLFSSYIPKEVIKRQKDLNEKVGLNYIIVLGEPMYYYVSCIGYGVTILSQLSSTPSDYNYRILYVLAILLCLFWGLSVANQ